MRHIIKEVTPFTIADDMGIQSGDELISINGERITDVFAFRLMERAERLTVRIREADGDVNDYEIEKDEDEVLGIECESGLMDAMTECRNKCVFCFVDQLPKGLRPSLYVKDDDMRLSFLTGNYVTLTNISDSRFAEIMAYHLSPINISVHTTNPALRVKMLGNSNAANLLTRLEQLRDNNIDMNFQIVLCKGLNDGTELDSTITALSRFYPRGRSLSVVPVGITRFRRQNGLYPLEPFSKTDCLDVIRQINAFQQRFLKELGTRFVYAGDELYIKAGVSLPKYKEYEDFPQIENGVGMMARSGKWFDLALKSAVTLCDKNTSSHVTLVTGVAAYRFVSKHIALLTKRFKSVRVDVVCVENRFFGEHITVAGLLTGRDIMDALKDREPSDIVIIPKEALKADEDVFLDDVRLEDLGENVVACSFYEIPGVIFMEGLTNG